MESPLKMTFRSNLKKINLSFFRTQVFEMMIFKGFAGICFFYYFLTKLYSRLHFLYLIIT